MERKAVNSVEQAKAVTMRNGYLKLKGPANDQVRPARRGQAAVEFALAGTVLIAVLFGVLEVGRLLFTYSEIQNAAREGAQIASLNPGIISTTLSSQVKAKLTGTNANTVTVTGPCFQDHGGAWICNPSSPCLDVEYCSFCNVKVNVSAAWTSVVSFVPSITLRTSSVKIIEAVLVCTPPPGS